MTYTIQREPGHENLDEIMPLYEAHYAETVARLARDGVRMPPFDMRLDQYRAFWEAGFLRNYVARHKGEAVGAANIYVTHDMHNRAPVAYEDSVYVRRDHRNGLGKRMVRFMLDDLAREGVHQVYIDAVTDLRVAKIWRRMGFRDYAQRMVYDLQED